MGGGAGPASAPPGAVWGVTGLHGLRDTRGSSVVTMLIVLPLLIFPVFYGIEAWVVVQRHLLMQHVLNTYIVRAQIEGEVSDALRAEIRSVMGRIGFDETKVEFGNSTPPGVVKHRGETVVLEIGYPKGPILTIVRLVGLKPPDPNGYMWVRGTTISERP